LRCRNAEKVRGSRQRLWFELFSFILLFIYSCARRPIPFLPKIYPQTPKLLRSRGGGLKGLAISQITQIAFVGANLVFALQNSLANFALSAVKNCLFSPLTNYHKHGIYINDKL
jgi:hypothetical protein